MQREKPHGDEVGVVARGYFQNSARRFLSQETFMKSVFYASAALMALGLPALAQGVEIDVVSGFPNPSTSEYIVVGATRLATPIEHVASSVTVITAADIEARQSRSLPDVLRDVPGVNIV